MFFVMEGWNELVLSLPGLHEGMTELKTTVSTNFFTQVEQSPVSKGSYDVHIVIDKKPALYIVDMDIAGWYEAPCDRCLQLIHIPGEAHFQYYFNKKGSPEGIEEEEDVFTLEEGTVKLDLRPLVYESIVLSLPLINVYNCKEDKPVPCDMKTLKILREKEEKESTSTDPAWDVLKNINFKE